MHKAIVREGEIGADSLVQAAVDRERRHAAEQAHTGTHIVHAALHQILGPEALQRGSFNKAGYLRFDFAWGEGLSPATRSEIEEVSNIAIRNNYRVETKIMGLAEAKALGAMALFGENYGNEVRVVEIDGAWSRELCGGTHVENTSLIGSLSLLGEQSVGSGNRRVEAFVGMDAFRHLAAERALVTELTDMLKVPSGLLADRIATTLTKLKTAEKELERLRKEQLTAAAGQLVGTAKDAAGIKVIAHDAGQVSGADDLRGLALDLRTRLGSEPAAVAVAGVSNDRPVILIATNEAARAAGVKAGPWCASPPESSAAAVAARTTSPRAAARMPPRSARHSPPSWTPLPGDNGRPVNETAVPGDYPLGVKLGVDVGTVRVGVAVCDRDGILATPLRTLERNAKKNTDVRILAALAMELGVVEIFVGLPRTMKGEEHASARMATDYAKLLAGKLGECGSGVPVRLVDERLSTVSAHRHLHEAGMSSRNHRKVVDQVAAAGILQHAIDMQKARGTEVGSRVYAESAPGPTGDGVQAGPALDEHSAPRILPKMEGYSEPGQQ